MNIAEKFKAVRKNLGKSQESVADALRCSRSRISGIENGTIIPKASELEMLCEAYHVTKEWLYGTDEQLPIFMNDKQNSRAQIAHRIKESRKKIGMTQVTLAEQSGIPRSTLAMVQAERNDISEQTARKIADACNVGLDWLLYGDEEQKDNPINDKVLDWLRHHPEKRKIIHEWMKEEEE